jgi:hypothetical protein
MLGVVLLSSCPGEYGHYITSNAQWCSSPHMPLCQRPAFAHAYVHDCMGSPPLLPAVGKQLHLVFVCTTLIWTLRA